MGSFSIEKGGKKQEGDLGSRLTIATHWPPTLGKSLRYQPSWEGMRTHAYDGHFMFSHLIFTKTSHFEDKKTEL